MFVNNSDNRTKLCDLLTCIYDLSTDTQNKNTYQYTNVSAAVVGRYKNKIREAIYIWNSKNHPKIYSKAAIDHTYKGCKQKYKRGWCASNKQCFVAGTEYDSTVSIALPVANESQIQTMYALQQFLTKGITINCDEGNAFNPLEEEFNIKLLRVKHKGEVNPATGIFHRFVNYRTGENSNPIEAYFGKLARYISSHSNSNSNGKHLIMHMGFFECLFNFTNHDISSVFINIIYILSIVFDIRKTEPLKAKELKCFNDLYQVKDLIKCKKLDNKYCKSIKEQIESGQIKLETGCKFDGYIYLVQWANQSFYNATWEFSYDICYDMIRKYNKKSDKEKLKKLRRYYTHTNKDSTGKIISNNKFKLKPIKYLSIWKVKIAIDNKNVFKRAKKMASLGYPSKYAQAHSIKFKKNDGLLSGKINSEDYSNNKGTYTCKVNVTEYGNICNYSCTCKYHYTYNVNNSCKINKNDSSNINQIEIDNNEKKNYSICIKMCKHVACLLILKAEEPLDNYLDSDGEDERS